MRVIGQDEILVRTCEAPLANRHRLAWLAVIASSPLGVGRQLAEDGGQDPAIAVVVDFDRGIDPHHGLEL